MEETGQVYEIVVIEEDGVAVDGVTVEDKEQKSPERQFSASGASVEDDAGNATWSTRKILLTILCLPNAKRIKESSTIQHSQDVLVSSVMIVAFILVIPLVVSIVELMGKGHLSGVVDVYISVVLFFGICACCYFLLSFYKFVRLYGFHDKSKENEQFKLVSSVNVKIFFVKLVLVLFMGLPSILRVGMDITDHIHYGRGASQVVNTVFALVFEILQLIFFVVALVYGIGRRAEFEFQRRFRANFAYAAALFCNVAVFATVFWSELDASNHHDHNKAQLALYTAEIEYSLYAVSLLSEFLPSSHHAYHAHDDQSSGGKKDIVGIMYREMWSICKRLLCTAAVVLTLVFPSLVFSLSVFIAVFYSAFCVMEEQMYDEVQIALPTVEIISEVICLVFLLIAYINHVYTSQKDRNVTFTQNEILLVLCGVCYFAFLIFQAIPIIESIQSGEANAGAKLDLVRILLQSAIIFYQTTFIINLKRAKHATATTVFGKYCPIMYNCDYIAMINLGLWFASCAKKSWNCTHGMYIDYYGEATWRVILHILFALGIFFRFHSFMLIIEFIPARHPMIFRCICNIIYRGCWNK